MPERPGPGGNSAGESGPDETLEAAPAPPTPCTGQAAAAATQGARGLPQAAAKVMGFFKRRVSKGEKQAPNIQPAPAPPPCSTSPAPPWISHSTGTSPHPPMVSPSSARTSGLPDEKSRRCHYIIKVVAISLELIKQVSKNLYEKAAIISS